MATTAGRRRRGVLEQQVLARLAMADGPLSPAEVQAALGGELAYTTVMTTLARLYGKRALNRVLDGRRTATPSPMTRTVRWPASPRTRC